MDFKSQQRARDLGFALEAMDTLVKQMLQMHEKLVKLTEAAKSASTPAKRAALEKELETLRTDYALSKRHKTPVRRFELYLNSA